MVKKNSWRNVKKNKYIDKNCTEIYNDELVGQRNGELG